MLECASEFNQKEKLERQTMRANDIGLAIDLFLLVLVIFGLIFWLSWKTIKLFLLGVAWVTMFPGTRFSKE